jgi:hypothetical protein
VTNLKATLLAAAVAVAFFAFAMQWRGLIMFALICFGLWYGWGWLKRFWPEAADFIANFGRGFFRGFFGRR